MKRALLLALLSLAIVSCDSNRLANDPTDTSEPIDPQELIGRWEGTYALTHDMGTDSAYTYSVGMWIEFSDTSFSFRGDDPFPCGAFGGGTYAIQGKVMEFWDQVPRMMVCASMNVLEGEFDCNYEAATSELYLTQRWDSYFWSVEVTKVPTYGLH